MKSWKSLFKFAISKGADVQTAEDFAQEASLALYKGRNAKTEWLWVDFLRTTVAGRTDSPNFEQRLAVRGSRNSELLNTIPDEPIDWRISSRLSEISVRDRVVIILSIKWGFTNEEIGEVLGVSSSRISQIINSIEASLRRFHDC